MSQTCDPTNPLGVNVPITLCDKNKKVHSATHVLRLSINLVPRVFVPNCTCWLDETSRPKGTKTLGTRVT